MDRGDGSLLQILPPDRGEDAGHAHGSSGGRAPAGHRSQERAAGLSQDRALRPRGADRAAGSGQQVGRQASIRLADEDAVDRDDHVGGGFGAVQVAARGGRV